MAKSKNNYAGIIVGKFDEGSKAVTLKSQNNLASLTRIFDTAHKLKTGIDEIEHNGKNYLFLDSKNYNETVLSKLYGNNTSIIKVGNTDAKKISISVNQQGNNELSITNG